MQGRVRRSPLNLSISAVGADCRSFAQRFDHSPCRLCGGGDGHESVYHLLEECPAPSLQRHRDHFLGTDLPAALRRIWHAGLDAHARGRGNAIAASPASERALLDIIDRRTPLDAARAGTRFLAYWALLATPWPQSVTTFADPAEHVAAAALGALFDALSIHPAVAPAQVGHGVAAVE